jgi:Ca-activated chloride channel homolog
MKSTLLAILTFLVAAYGTAAMPGESRRLNSQGVEKYSKGEFKAAEEAFKKASEVSKNDPALRYNLGAAQVRTGKTKDAQNSFNSVFSESNPTLNAAAKYNGGVLQHKSAMDTIEKMKQSPTGVQDQPIDPRELTDTAMKQLTGAIEQYKSAILSNPVDVDMKVNYELARRQLEELKNQQQQQQQKQDEQNQQQQQDQNNQQKQDQQDQQKQDQKEQQDKQDQQKQDQQKQQKDQSQDSQDKKQEEQQKDKEDKQDEQGKPKPTPTPKPDGKPEEKKEPDKKDDEKPADPSDSGEIKDVPIGEMSEHDVNRLLNSLPPEDQKALQRMLNNPMGREPEMENDW